MVPGNLPRDASVVFVIGYSGCSRESRPGGTWAVADSQTVAMAMGINVPRLSPTGGPRGRFRVGRVFWGALGVDNQLALIGMKVFPVVILGGLDPIPGAVVGASCGRDLNLTAGYPTHIRRRHQDLVPPRHDRRVDFRPYGLFGKKRITLKIRDQLLTTRPIGRAMRRLRGSIPRGCPSALA